jgi:hypothetical protein
LLEARNAIEIVKSAGGEKYATESYQKAAELLKTAESYLTLKRDKKVIDTAAREAVQTAEDARIITVKHREEERLAQERQAAADREAQAKAQAEASEKARLEAQLAAERSARERAEAEAARAAAQAQADKERLAAADALAHQQAAEADAERAHTARARRSSVAPPPLAINAGDGRLLRAGLRANGQRHALQRSRSIRPLPRLPSARQRAPCPRGCALRPLQWPAQNPAHAHRKHIQRKPRMRRRPALAPLPQSAKAGPRLGLGHIQRRNRHQPARLQMLQIRQPLQHSAASADSGSSPPCSPPG